MEKVSTSTRLKEIINERKLKQVDILNACVPFCKKYGVKMNKSDISQYVSGKVEPNQEKLFVLGNALGVSEAWLMGYDVSMERPKSTQSIDNILPLPKTYSVPLLGEIACGKPIFAEENIEGMVKIPESVQADFALRCKGDSMIGARILDGDIVYIRQQPDVDDGEIAAVLIDNEATLKRVYKMPGRLQLRAENPAFSPINLEGEELETVRILGKAVAFSSPVK